MKKLPADRFITARELEKVLTPLVEHVQQLERTIRWKAAPFWLRWFVTLSNLKRKRADGRTGTN